MTPQKYKKKCLATKGVTCPFCGEQSEFFQDTHCCDGCGGSWVLKGTLQIIQEPQDLLIEDQHSKQGDR